MQSTPFTGAEIGVLVVAALPWLVGLAVVLLAVGLLRRAVRAQERIADALERQHRPD